MVNTKRRMDQRNAVPNFIDVGTPLHGAPRREARAAAGLKVSA